MFQGTLFAEQDMRKLIFDINNTVEPEQQRDPADIETLFPKLWPELQSPVGLILKNAIVSQDCPEPEKVDSGQILSEMMALLRQQNAVLAQPERLVSPILEWMEKNIGTNRISTDRASSRPATKRFYTRLAEELDPNQRTVPDFTARIEEILADSETKKERENLSSYIKFLKSIQDKKDEDKKE